MLLGAQSLALCSAELKSHCKVQEHLLPQGTEAGETFIVMREIKQILILKQLCPHKDDFLREETKTRVEKYRQGLSDL